MTDERRIWRAMVVDRWGAVTWDQYIRAMSRADNGHDPADR